MPTRSPTLNSSPASAPIWTTSPTTSWPGVTRSRCTGRSPSVTCRSVRHTPHARTATSNSDGSGRGTSVVTCSSGPVSIGPGRRTRHARIVAVAAGGISPSCRYLPRPQRVSRSASAHQTDDPQQDHCYKQRDEEREPLAPMFHIDMEPGEEHASDKPADHADDDVEQDA